MLRPRFGMRGWLNGRPTRVFCILRRISAGDLNHDPMTEGLRMFAQTTLSIAGLAVYGRFAGWTRWRWRVILDHS